MASLVQFLRLFWSMAKHVQDEFLRLTLAGGQSDTRKPWFLLGKRFGPKCVLAILGVGNARLARVEQGRFDRRFRVWGGVPSWSLIEFSSFPNPKFNLILLFPCPYAQGVSGFPNSAAFASKVKKRSPVKTRLINQFFLSVYVKSAGMLPDKCLDWQ